MSHTSAKDVHMCLMVVFSDKSETGFAIDPISDLA